MILEQSYEAWKNCLFSVNGQKFSRDFLESRLSIMEDEKHPERIKFINAYGQEYFLLIISYFKQALSEIK